MVNILTISYHGLLFTAVKCSEKGLFFYHLPSFFYCLQFTAVNGKWLKHGLIVSSSYICICLVCRNGNYCRMYGNYCLRYAANPASMSRHACALLGFWALLYSLIPSILTCTPFSLSHNSFWLKIFHVGVTSCIWLYAPFPLVSVFLCQIPGVART